MRRVFKKAFFAIYVAGVRTRALFVGDNVVPVQQFIWKDSWFLLWHLFLWGCARNVCARFTAITPLACERSAELMKHHQRFSELAERDSTARPMEERILQPTRYRLSADAAKELCLLYGCVAAMAPWQYGLPARLRARVRMRSASLIFLIVFIGSIALFAPGSDLVAYLLWGSFFSLLFTIAGWCADSSLCRMAYEAERLQQQSEAVDKSIINAP